MDKVEDLQIMVRYKGQELYRNYLIQDGNAPEICGEEVQDMMETIKNTAKVPF